MCNDDYLRLQVFHLIRYVCSKQDLMVGKKIKKKIIKEKIKLKKKFNISHFIRRLKLFPQNLWIKNFTFSLI